MESTDNKYKKNCRRGIFLTIMGGVCWGFSGVCGSYLFESKELNAPWLVSVRLLIAGTLMFLYSCKSSETREKMKELKSDKKDFVWMVIFGMSGLMACQLTYFLTIQTSNASTATILQYTSPAIIMFYTAYKNKKRPSNIEFISLFFVIFGIFLLATHGHPGSLAISKQALFWGLISSFTVVLYNVMPVGLMNKYGTIAVTGLGMLFGGIVLSMFTHPWNVPGIWDWKTFAGMATVILVGTIASFSMYLEGVRLIGATKASMFASSEPLTAAVLTVVLMGVSLSILDIVGLVCILVAATMLSKGSK